MEVFLGNLKKLIYENLKYLDLDIEKGLEELFSLRMDIVRLGLYWNEIEKSKRKFDFNKISQILEMFETTNREVVLTVGMKAPRWPEFYLPTWLKDKKPEDIKDETLNFVENCVKRLKGYSCIKYWQIENEPLDPSGPKKLIVPYEILKEEVDLVRSLDKRRILINLWGNEFTKRNFYPVIADLANIIGIDITGYIENPKEIIAYGKKLKKLLISTGIHDPKSKVIAKRFFGHFLERLPDFFHLINSYLRRIINLFVSSSSQRLKKSYPDRINFNSPSKI